MRQQPEFKPGKGSFIERFKKSLIFLGRQILSVQEVREVLTITTPEPTPKPENPFLDRKA